MILQILTEHEATVLFTLYMVKQTFICSNQGWAALEIQLF